MVMIMSILWLGIFSVIAMNHGNVMHAGCASMDFIGEGAPFQPMDSNFCTDVHMGMVQETFHAIPGNIDFGAGMIAIISLVFLLSMYVRDGDEGVYALCRVRYRERFDKQSGSFFVQINDWIASLEKRDPSVALA